MTVKTKSNENPLVSQTATKGFVHLFALVHKAGSNVNLIDKPSKYVQSLQLI